MQNRVDTKESGEPLGRSGDGIQGTTNACSRHESNTIAPPCILSCHFPFDKNGEHARDCVFRMDGRETIITNKIIAKMDTNELTEDAAVLGNACAPHAISSFLSTLPPHRRCNVLVVLPFTHRHTQTHIEKHASTQILRNHTSHCAGAQPPISRIFSSGFVDATYPTRVILERPTTRFPNFNLPRLNLNTTPFHPHMSTCGH